MTSRTLPFHITFSWWLSLPLALRREGPDSAFLSFTPCSDLAAGTLAGRSVRRHVLGRLTTTRRLTATHTKRRCCWGSGVVVPLVPRISGLANRLIALFQVAGHPLIAKHQLHAGM